MILKVLSVLCGTVALQAFSGRWFPKTVKDMGKVVDRVHDFLDGWQKYIKNSRPTRLRAGDASVFPVTAVHKGPENDSERPRNALFATVTQYGKCTI